MFDHKPDASDAGPRDGSHQSAEKRATRLLLVDDDQSIVKAYGRVLTRAGYDVRTATSGRSVPSLLEDGDFDVLVSDIAMPGMDGFELLQAVRQRDPDLPIVLMTGGAAVDGVVRALEQRVLSYLVKPVDPERLRTTVAEAVRLRGIAKAERRALEVYRASKANEERRELTESFERALGSLSMVYQPIVRWSERRVFAYEALVRNEEDGLRRPDHLFAAAEKLDRLDALGHLIRERVAGVVPLLPADALMFVNLHPRDLRDPELFESEAPLSRVASRVVLEITERASLESLEDVHARLESLKRLGFRTAVDDLGAGYAGLNAFARLQPGVVKLDMSLIRDIDASPVKQKLVESMVSLCHDLCIDVVAEGIETRRERGTLIELGCDLFQGYFFGRPGCDLSGNVNPSVLS